MPRRWIIGLSALLASAFACWPGLLGTDQSLSQNWVGELKIGEIKHFVQLRLDGDREPTTGTIAYPASGMADIPLSGISVERGHVAFAWTDNDRPLSFYGSLSEGLLTGTVRTGNTQGTLQLAPTVKLSAEAEQRLLGYYEMRPAPHFVGLEVSRGSSLFGLRNRTSWRSFSLF